MKVLVIDVGVTSVKMLASGREERCKFPSGATLTPRQMVAEVKVLARDWGYDVVSIGYPGRVVAGSPVTEPRNLAEGWVGFDFVTAFGCPVRIINDAAMQALGSYRGGAMLFLGLGTGLGSALMVRGHVVPMELGALSYKRGTVEDYLGARGLAKRGKQKWRRSVGQIVERLTTALFLDDFVIGGGNAKKLKQAPTGFRLGSNSDAFTGGFRLWERAGDHKHVAWRPHIHHEAGEVMGAST
jgi:polyphosphate glucokinase